jgi:hypothetical protein
MQATIYEQGQGFPSVGAIVQCDGGLYRVVSISGDIQVGSTIGHSVDAVIEGCWPDDDEIVYPCRVDLV